VVVVVPSDHAPVDADRLLDELRDMARRSLADYKAPDRIVVAGSLPLTSMMKVDKRALAAIAAQALSGGTDHDHHANGWQDRRQPTNGVSAS
jgi:non-ribosomal peptide synthetase component E (peptide arylation enzyme)